MKYWYLAVFLIGLTACGTLQSEISPPTPTDHAETEDALSWLETAQAPLPVIPSDDPRSLGDPNAPVTIIEYSDFQCPYCLMHFTKTFPEIKRNYIDTGKVRYVFRNLINAPSHTAAPIAAAASLCAAQQGWFWAFHDRVFVDSDVWGDTTRTTAVMREYAKEINLDMTQFDTCLEDPIVAQQVVDEEAKGYELGSIGTPTFFINDKFLSGAHDYTTFVEVIEAELAGKGGE